MAINDLERQALQATLSNLLDDASADEVGQIANWSIIYGLMGVMGMATTLAILIAVAPAVLPYQFPQWLFPLAWVTELISGVSAMLFLHFRWLGSRLIR